MGDLSSHCVCALVWLLVCLVACVSGDSEHRVCFLVEGELTVCRVPTRPGKPGKLRVHLENLEISWNFEKFNKYHGKMT